MGTRNSGVIYLLGAGVSVGAAKLYCAFDPAPSFWKSLIDQAGKGNMRSIDKVGVDLGRRDDKLRAGRLLAQWFETAYDEDLLKQYRGIMKWAIPSDFEEKARKDFAGKENADARVVAHAAAKGHVVVAHERYKLGVKRKIPVPNVCKNFGMRSLDAFQMLRELGIRLGCAGEA